jgi:hypothetical protein
MVMAGSGKVACAACSGSDPIECLVQSLEHQTVTWSCKR